MASKYQPQDLRLEVIRRGLLSGISYCPQVPQPKQVEFLNLPNDEALLGGGAGRGGSSALLMEAFKHVHISSYKALIVRRTYSDLGQPDAIMDRAISWCAPFPEIKWSNKDKVLLFPSGARIKFGHMEHERSKFQYQGAAFDVLLPDECSQLTETQYLYLFSRLRRNKLSNIKPLCRATSNPGGNPWVKERFINNPQDRAVVLGTLKDNKYLDQESYEKALNKLGPVARRQLLLGEWIDSDTDLVFRFSVEKNLTQEIPKDKYQSVLGMDFGHNDATAWCVLQYSDTSPIVYIPYSRKEVGMIPSEVASITKELDDTYHFDVMVGDTGGLGKGYVEEAKRRWRLPLEQAEKRNKRGYIDLLNGALQLGEIKILEGTNSDLLEELQSIYWNSRKLDVKDGSMDDLAHAMLYGWRRARAYDYAPVKAPAPTKGKEYENAIVEKIEAGIRAEQAQEWWERGAALYD